MQTAAATNVHALKTHIDDIFTEFHHNYAVHIFRVISDEPHSTTRLLLRITQSKLETYRDLEKTGKELSGDMKVAVSKYGEVAQTLEFAREFSKLVLQVATTSEKELKKKQKKDEAAKKQGDISRIREVLIMQNLLGQLGAGTVARDDFLAERNGACKLAASELELLDEL